jgi:hypothetical protein
MPPPKSRKVLSPPKEILRKGSPRARPGSPTGTHHPQRPALPVVKNAKWVRIPSTPSSFREVKPPPRPARKPTSAPRVACRSISWDSAWMEIAYPSPTPRGRVRVGRPAPRVAPVRRASCPVLMDSARYADTHASTSTTSGTSGHSVTGSSAPSTEPDVRPVHDRPAGLATSSVAHPEQTSPRGSTAAT